MSNTTTKGERLIGRFATVARRGSADAWPHPGTVPFIEFLLPDDRIVRWQGEACTAARFYITTDSPVRISGFIRPHADGTLRLSRVTVLHGDRTFGIGGK